MIKEVYIVAAQRSALTKAKKGSLPILVPMIYWHN